MTEFPATVDETTGRITAAMVATLSLAAAAVAAWSYLPAWPIAALVAVDLFLRALSGPAEAPLSRLAALIARRAGLSRRPTAGAPKRFAATLGAGMATAATLAALLGASTVALVVLLVLATCATLEAAFGFCVGCVAYRRLTAWGLISDPACVECVDISARPSRRAR